MVAAAYKATLSVAVDGQVKSIVLTGSDVTTEAWTYPDGSEATTLGSGAAVIRDVIYSAAGTDTTQVDVYVNGIFTNYTLQNSANLGTVYNRQVQVTPIGIKPGATVKFIQKT